MAAQHLTVFTHPAFPQVFEDAISYEVRRVSRIVDHALGVCDFADEHCDCRAKATVHHLASEQEFCLRHFQEVNRG